MGENITSLEEAVGKCWILTVTYMLIVFKFFSVMEHLQVAILLSNHCSLDLEQHS